MDKRISKEIAELFKSPEVVSIEGVRKEAFDVNDGDFMNFVTQSIVDRRKIDNDNTLTIVCKQQDKNGTTKDVKYIFVIPQNYPLIPPIIKTDKISETYNGYGLPRVTSDGDLFDNNIYNVAGIETWGPNFKLLDIIKDAQARELDPKIDIVVDTNSTFQIEKPKGGKRKTKKRRSKRSKKSRRFK
jgi:hypothetical protein